MTKNKTNNDLLVDVQMERACLVAILTDIYATAHMQAIAHLLIDDDFTETENRQTWQAVKKCYDDGKEISPINVYSAGKEIGIDAESIVNRIVEKMKK